MISLSEFNAIIKSLNDVDNFLQGKVHSKELSEIAKHAATRAVLERRTSLLERLARAGLKLDVEA